MTIQEAIKSGKSFKRPKHGCYFVYDNLFDVLKIPSGSAHDPTAMDVIADDWEIEPEPEPEKKVEVTESQLKDLFKQCLWDVQANKLSSARGDIEGFYFHTLKRIGELFSQ